MAFDIAEARKAGYSETEIADYLGSARGFDVIGARKAGWEDKDIVSHLAQSAPAKTEIIAEPRGLGQELARQVGLTARAGVKAATALPEIAVNAVGGLAGQPGFGSRGVDAFLNWLGVPEPETGMERFAGHVASGMGGTGAFAKAGQLARPATELGRNIAEQFSRNIGGQVAASGAASGTGAAIAEAGGGPLAQMAGGLIAGVAAPMGVQYATQFPARVLARSITQSEKRPFAQEGTRLAEQTGIDLPIGPRSGNKMMLSLENAARKYPLSADRAQEVYIKLANQAIERVSKLADAISTKRGDVEHLGQGVQITVQRAADKIASLREEQAGIDYGQVRAIAGDKPVIKLDNFVNTLRGIIDEYANVAGPARDPQKIVSQAQAALDRVSDESGLLANTINQAMRTRKFYGAAAAGKANVFEDIAPDLQRRLSARLFGAINKDFEDSAVNAGGALKAALDKANANYSAHSASLEYLQKSALGKLVGDDLVDAAMSGRATNTVAGEAVMKKIATMEPSTRATSIKIIDQWNPDLGKQLRANVLRSALDEAAAIQPSAKGASEIPISFNLFVRAIGGQKSSFTKQLESYGFSLKEISDIKDTATAMMRAGDTSGMNFSNTAVMQDTMEIAGALGKAGATGATWGPLAGLRSLGTGLLSISGKRIGMNKIVDAMASEEGRKALRTVSSPRASPSAVIAAFETIEGKPDGN